MESLYREINTSRQAIAQATKRDQQSGNIEEQLVHQVKQWREIHPKMGSRSLYFTLRDIAGVQMPIGINKFEKLLRERDLLVKGDKNWIKTSDGLGRENYPNLISGLQINGINQVIVGDITYYSLEGRWAYIFTLKDIYSQYILGLVPALSLEAEHALQCLQSAVNVRKEENLIGGIHHTDNGSQYNASSYKKYLTNMGLRISRAANCLENGSAENLNGLIKNSYLKPWRIQTFKQLQEACKELIYINNEQRAIEELGHLSPVQFEEVINSLPISDRPTKQLYDFY